MKDDSLIQIYELCTVAEACAIFAATKQPLKKGTQMDLRGNLWRELWEIAKPIPVFKQSPLYYKDLSVSYKDYGDFQDVRIGGNLMLSDGVRPESAGHNVTSQVPTIDGYSSVFETVTPTGLASASTDNHARTFIDDLANGL
ncbi:rab3 GTPase-activating protein catalytic subunit [Artemisia annua]|uniref:Rab3 GTPase-activating protein catalytic subunit n=1 Tax=Artemisia annua TaxID=35608 RepID=A0A2U1NFH4_ARTAN|nr:rab3 GTPase-activating protein catalytic subunit [Artemisia annua]